MLYFVEEEVCHPVLLNERLDMVVEVLRVAEFIVVVILEVQIHNLFRRNAMRKKPVAIDFHDSGLTATAYAGYHLYEILVLKGDEFVKVGRAFYPFHNSQDF